MNSGSSSKGGPPLSKSMKAVGRNMAKANMQKGSKKTPMVSSTGGGSAPYGGGEFRTGKAQTQGKGWKGVT